MTRGFRSGDDLTTRLGKLYRASEERSTLTDLDAEVRDTFIGDGDFMRELTAFAASRSPQQRERGRVALLMAVSSRREASASRGRRPMLQQLLSARALAAIAAAGIFAGGAATVGASGGVSGAAGNVQDVLQALHIEDRTPDQADVHIDEISGGNGHAESASDAASTDNSESAPDATSTEASGKGLDNADEHANDASANGRKNSSEGADNAGQGIDNASEEGQEHAAPPATGGEPEPHANVTPPAGGDDTPGSGAPKSLPSAASGHGNGGGDHTPGH